MFLCYVCLYIYKLYDIIQSLITFTKKSLRKNNNFRFLNNCRFCIKIYLILVKSKMDICNVLNHDDIRLCILYESVRYNNTGFFVPRPTFHPNELVKFRRFSEIVREAKV